MRHSTFADAHLATDARGDQLRGERFAQQQVIDKRGQDATGRSVLLFLLDAE